MILSVTVAVCVLHALPTWAQTVGTGNIVGIVADPQGKPLADAKVEITNKARAAAIHLTTSAAGLYSSGPIQPGTYQVQIAVKGFNAITLTVLVRVGNTATADVKFQPATEKPQPNLPAVLNLEQAAVQGVIEGEQVETLPIDGKNFIDLAQLQPGIQVQDGSLFQSKNGLSAISIQNQFGRGESISLDGVDIGDETVGTTTQNVPSGAIREFQVAQSLLDLSTGLTTTGAVNVITRSGSDQIHGEAFGVYRGDQGAAPLPGSSLPGATASSFQRELFGADAGGAIIKDKAFWFADAERATQNLTSAVPFTYPFDGLNASLSEPYREFDTDERVDWNMRGSTRAFYRFNFFENNDVRPYGSASSTQQFRNINNTATNALGFDFNTGLYAHSLRFEYLKLRSETTDATGNLGGVENPIPGLGINIGAATAGNCILSNGGNYCGGPSWLGPQQTVQSDKVAKYDGSRLMGAHVIRYGITLSRIDAARLADYSAFPQVGTTVGGASADPTSYPADWVSLGNGIGFSTAKSAFGFPGGGLNPDDRVELYVGDAWKAKPKLTLTYGLHYLHDTGRTDSNLSSVPSLNQWGPGYGDRIRNPNLNVAPQFGFAWDAGGEGKTVIRGGAGLIYGNTLANNVLFDSPARLSKGNFLDTPEVCSGGIAAPFLWPTSLAGISSIAGGAATVVTTPVGLEAQPTFCGGTISTVAPQILALSGAYQAASASVPGSQANSSFVGTALSALNSGSHDLLYPDFRTPRAWQMNLGFQKEIRRGTVLTMDYLRSIGEHFLIGQDINHSGAARSFNQANAIAARDRAQAAIGCPIGLGQATCMIGILGQAGAQAAYSAAGLDSNSQTTGGGPCSYCAFPGTNAVTGNVGAVGGVDMLFSDGRSLYSGAEVKLVQRIDHPMGNVRAADFRASYTLSRFVSQQQDQDTINMATDNDDPTRFTGPTALDRKQQVSFGGTFDLPFLTKFALVGHFYSPLAQNLLLPELTHGGEIFASDWLGAGLPSDGAPEPIPGTKLGQFEHGTDLSNLQNVINNYNHRFGGNLTPAGQCLVADQSASFPAGFCPGQISQTQVMTVGDMSALGWTMPIVGSMPPHATGIPWQKSIDLRVSWPYKIKEGVTIEPSASVFNVFNFANEFLPGNLPSASLAPSNPACVSNGNCGALPLAANVIGGVNPGTSLTPFRAGLQSGTFAMGAPRQFEFGLRISF
ncbi:MAG: carboxypeptidase regulatory-like domain-containing protein [Candidatus Sulfotelmatobacter sp.]